MPVFGKPSECSAGASGPAGTYHWEIRTRRPEAPYGSTTLQGGQYEAGPILLASGLITPQVPGMPDLDAPLTRSIMACWFLQQPSLVLDCLRRHITKEEKGGRSSNLASERDPVPDEVGPRRMIGTPH